MLLRLLLVVEPATLKDRLLRLLGKEQLVINAAPPTVSTTLREARRENFDVMILSRSVLGETHWDLLTKLQVPDNPLEIVVIAEHDDAEDQARLLAAGCLSVLHTGLPDNVLHEALVTVIERRRSRADQTVAARRKPATPQLSDFVSASPAMQAFINVAQRVAASDSSLLITGETGVGKERLARAIHAEGPRSSGPFVAVNCGALPETLLESELFGHEEGAFTGAARARRGWFELAHGGTIFLDEIGEMPLHLQVKLLHVLQNHEVQRLGSERTLEVDVRVVAATNRDLVQEVDEGRFRRDLYYRLSVIHLAIPPLRERREDIPSLIDDYISRFRISIGRDVTAITSDAVSALVNYTWPGNVRELINVIERAVLLCEGNTIQVADLPASIGRRDDKVSTADAVPARPGEGEWRSLPEGWWDLPLRDVRDRVVAEIEEAYLRRLLFDTKGRVGETARRAGIEPRSLYEKMRRYGLRKEDFR